MKTRNATLALLLLCFAAILGPLCSCQMAREDTVMGMDSDRLAGVLVTTEDPELETFGEYGDNRYDENNSRLYATMREKTLVGEDGETRTQREYVFEGLFGFPLFACVLSGGESVQLHCASFPGNGFSATRFEIGTMDNSGDEFITLEGRIGILPTFEGTFFCNPVYQTQDGRLYVTRGGRAFVLESRDVLSGSTSIHSHTRIVNGEKILQHLSITISLEIMLAPEKIAFLSMDEGGRLIAKSEFMPGEVPETFAPVSGSAFIVVETARRDSQGNESVTRQVYGRNSSSLGTFIAREDGVCIRWETGLLWLGQ